MLKEHTKQISLQEYQLLIEHDVKSHSIKIMKCTTLLTIEKFGIGQRCLSLQMRDHFYNLYISSFPNILIHILETQVLPDTPTPWLRIALFYGLLQCFQTLQIKNSLTNKFTVDGSINIVMLSKYFSHTYVYGLGSMQN